MPHHQYDVYVLNTEGKWIRDETWPEGYWWFGGDMKVPPAHEYLADYSGTRSYQAYESNQDIRHPQYLEGNCQFRPWLDKKWKEREAKLFETGMSQPLPWGLEPIADHFARLAFGDENLVEFIENEKQGMQGRTTKIKPGRYVARFYPHLSKDEVRAYAVQIDAAGDVAFASSPEDIEHVYVNGPRSCMSYAADDFESEFHPVRVYGNSDLQVAYLSTVAIDDDRFHPSARAVVWPERKIFGRLYGDELRLAAKLEALGYTRGSLEGARFRAVKQDGVHIVPYVDGALAANVSSCGKWLIIASGGEVNCEVTTGLSEENRNYCEYHGEYTHEDLVWIEDRSEYWSESAASNHATFCRGHRVYYSSSMEFFEIGGYDYSLDYLENHGTRCERTDEWFLDSDDTVELEDTDETVALTWADRHAFEVDGLWYAECPKDDNGDPVECDNSPVQPRCTETLEMVLEMPEARPEPSERSLGALSFAQLTNPCQEMTLDF